MGRVRGDPLVLVTLFFAAAVLSMGGVYALIPSVLSGPTLGQFMIFLALAFALGVSLLVIGRVFWIVARVKQKLSAAGISKKN